MGEQKMAVALGAAGEGPQKSLTKIKHNKLNFTILVANLFRH